MAEYLTTAEVAEFYQCSVETVRRRVKDGTLEAVRLTPTGPLRYDRDALPLEGNIMINARPDREYPELYAGRHFDPNKGKHVRVRLKCPDKNPNSRANKMFERRIMQQLADGSFWKEKATVVTLRNFAPRLLAHLEANEKKESYIDSARMILTRHLIPTLGDKPLASLRAIDIDEYKGSRKKGEYTVPNPETGEDEPGQKLKPKTINNHLGVISKLLKVAHANDLIPKALKMQLLPVADPEWGYWTQEEADHLVAACTTQPRFARLHGLIVTGLGTGMRLGELMGLRWGDVDLKDARPYLTVRRQYCAVKKGFTTPKNGSTRVLRLPSSVITVLKDYPKHFRSKLIFCTPEGKPGRKDGLVKSIQAAYVRAGLESEGIGFHRLRHTYASWLVQRGIDLYTVQRLLGHKTISQTQRYAHLAPDNFERAVAVLA